MLRYGMAGEVTEEGEDSYVYIYTCCSLHDPGSARSSCPANTRVGTSRRGTLKNNTKHGVFGSILSV